MSCAGEGEKGVAEDVLLWSRLLQDPILTEAGDCQGHSEYLSMCAPQMLLDPLVTSSVPPADVI